MPRSRLCSFCGHEFPPGTGIMYVKKDGGVLWFCSGRCRKSSLELKSDARKMRWTKYFGKEEKGKA